MSKPKAGLCECGEAYSGWFSHLKAPRHIEHRFWSKVEWSEGCWGWSAAHHPSGYAAFGLRDDSQAHRAAYTLAVGQIPEGMELDHLCRNRGCVNPAHLEPVTKSLNRLRAPRPERCRVGHSLSDAYVSGTTGRRRCRPCQQAQNREKYARHREARVAYARMRRLGTLTTPSQEQAA